MGLKRHHVSHKRAYHRKISMRMKSILNAKLCHDYARTYLFKQKPTICIGLLIPHVGCGETHAPRHSLPNVPASKRKRSHFIIATRCDPQMFWHRNFVNQSLLRASILRMRALVTLLGSTHGAENSYRVGKSQDKHKTLWMVVEPVF